MGARGQKGRKMGQIEGMELRGWEEREMRRR